MAAAALRRPWERFAPGTKLATVFKGDVFIQRNERPPSEVI